jgi:uncharacterized protein YgbK (DUF1537 family)
MTTSETATLIPMAPYRGRRGDSWADDALQRAADLRERYSDGPTLAAAGRDIAALATRVSAVAVVGASSIGDRLASAAVVTSTGALSLWTPSCRRRTLIVEGLVVSGTQIVRTARRLRSSGVGSIVAVAVDTDDEIVNFGSDVDEFMLVGSAALQRSA